MFRLAHTTERDAWRHLTHISTCPALPGQKKAGAFRRECRLMGNEKSLLILLFTRHSFSMRAAMVYVVERPFLVRARQFPFCPERGSQPSRRGQNRRPGSGYFDRPGIL